VTCRFAGGGEEFAHYCKPVFSVWRTERLKDMSSDF
jgi:hypothetical protein